MPTSCSRHADPPAAKPAGPSLWVVMPVYNEAGALRAVIEEWLPALRACAADVRVSVVDDGSTDATPAVLEALAREHPEIDVVTQANRGHGRACLRGYRRALAGGARFVLQIDSDGQCDPAYFPAFWRLRAAHPLVFGRRVIRRDGRSRRAVSRLLALGALVATGVPVRDPNVPYRLMEAGALRGVVDAVPDDVELVNVYLAVALEARVGIRWVDIVFRERLAGRSHTRWAGMLRRGARVLGQLARDRRRLRAVAGAHGDGGRGEAG